MTLLFDDTKKLEKAFGEEAASVLIKILENQDAEAKKELATKADLDRGLKELELRLTAEIAKGKADMLKWVGGMLAAQAGIIAALVKLL